MSWINFSTISFKLRTSLNSISGFAELILIRHDNVLSGEQKEYISDVLTSSKDLQKYLAYMLEKNSHPTTHAISDLSFKLRTALSNIIGFAQLIHDGKTGTVSAENKEYLSYIMSSSNETLKFADDMFLYME